MRNKQLIGAAALGFWAIIFGAFGAHAWQGRLRELETVSLWQTAVLYHLVHVPVLLWLSREKNLPRGIYAAFTVGLLIFSGSLYLLAMTGMRWLGAVTPLGGLSLLVGWAGLGVWGWKQKT